jgi:hypothetical protein
MLTNNYYEDLSADEADFILDIYRVIDSLVYYGHPVTLVRLGFELGVSPQELSDYLPTIVTILTKVEEEYAEVRQGSN